MRIILSGGGTAGHITPAIAIAETVLTYDRTAEITFVGTPHGMENELVGRAGYPMRHVNVRGFSRSLSLRNIGALYLALVSPLRAERILADLCPDIVIGTGGYASWPILRAAARRGIPCAVHESNAVPGMTVKRLAPLVSEVWLNFKEANRYLPKNSSRFLETGNPIRRDFRTVSRGEARKRLGLTEKDFLLLSFGGSLGAARINEVAPLLGAALLPRFQNLRYVHGSGRAHYEEMCKKEGGFFHPRFSLLPYIEDMPLYMGAADTVICRAGAMTISELSLCQKCAILIPSPNVADDHQTKNAMLLEKSGAAAVMEESLLSAEGLAAQVARLIEDPLLRAERERRIRRFSHPDANGRILSRVLELTQKNPK